MRRKDKEVTSQEALLQIINQCKVCRIATRDEDGPYLIPLSFGYEYEGGRLTLFIHSAKEGRKVEAFRINHQVAFEMDCEISLIEGTSPCSYSCAYRCITGNGTISPVEDLEEKKRGLALLTKHQTGTDFQFNDAMASAVLVYKIEVRQFTGKESG